MQKRYLKIINTNFLSRVTGVNYQKINNNFKGLYNSLTVEEKAAIAKNIYVNVKQVFSYLGVEIMLKSTHQKEMFKLKYSLQKKEEKEVAND